MRQNRQMLYNENNYTEENYIDWLREFKSEENVDWEEGNTADFMDWCNTMQENDFDDLVFDLSVVEFSDGQEWLKEAKTKPAN